MVRINPDTQNQRKLTATKDHALWEEFQASAELSVHARNVLERARIHRFAELARLSETELSRLPGAGSKTVSELRDFVGRQSAHAQFNSLSNYEAVAASDSESEADVHEEFQQAYESLSVRARNALLQNGLAEPLKLCNVSEDTVLSIRSVGRKTLQEIMDIRAKVRRLLQWVNENEYSDDVILSIDQRDVTLSVTSNFESLLCLSADDAYTAFDLIVTTVPKFESVVCTNRVNEGRELSDIRALVDYVERTLNSGGASQAIETRLRLLAQVVSECGDEFHLEPIATAIYRLRGASMPKVLLSPLLLGRIGPRICRILAPKEMHIPALIVGFGLDPTLPTLDALGRSVGVCRERARQFQQRALSILRDYPKLMAWVADNARLIVDEFGGYVGASELEYELLGHRSVNGQVRLPASIKFFASGSEWMEAGLTLDGDIVRSDVHGQELSAQVNRAIYNAAHRAADDQPESNLWSASFEAVVRQVALALDAQYPQGVRVSEAVIRASIANENDLLRLDCERVYCLIYWQLLHGTVPERVEAVLLQAGRPLHYSEIYAGVKRWNYLGRTINPRGGIERSPNVMLWDRGTYVHRMCVRLPYDLLREVGAWLERKLANSVPYVSVAGAFDTFATQCVEAGIPNRHALYGALRQSATNNLEFSEYPYIQHQSVTGQRLPVPIVIENFIKEAGGFISRSEVTTFVQRDLSVSVALIPLHIGNVPNVLIAKSNFIHVDNLRLDLDAVCELEEYCESELTQHSQISIGTLMKSRRVLCMLAGIDDARLLHSVIVHFSKGRFAGECPHLVRSGNEGAVATISDIAADFVREYAAPCSLQVLAQYLVDQRGYDIRHSYMVNYNEDIVRFSASTVVHLHVIEWNPEKQRIISGLAHKTYTSARERGELWGRISSIVEQYETQMPDLVNAVWTETLLASLLQRDPKWLLLGNAKDAFVPRDNPEEIDQLDRVVELILDRDYCGATQREPFEEELREKGLIQLKITQTMLGKFSPVIVTDDAGSRFVTCDQASSRLYST